MNLIIILLKKQGENEIFQIALEKTLYPPINRVKLMKHLFSTLGLYRFYKHDSSQKPIFIHALIRVSISNMVNYTELFATIQFLPNILAIFFRNMHSISYSQSCNHLPITREAYFRFLLVWTKMMSIDYLIDITNTVSHQYSVPTI